MVKRMCLLFISSLVAIAMSPSFLTSADDVVVTGVNDARAVETIPLSERELEPEPVVESVVATRAPQAGIVTAPVTPNYTVTSYVGSISEYVASYNNLSYSAIYKYNKMVYGHNTANLLGSLANCYVGETITITEGGVARNYRVSEKVYYNKTADGNLNNDPRLMSNIANTALGHDVAMMTCAGQMIGGGDATQRLVIYADAI